LDRRLRLLVVSHTFPPLAEVGAIRVSQLCRYLPDWGIEPIVLSAQERSSETQDYSRPLPAGLRVLRAPMMSTPLDWYASFKRVFGRGESATAPERAEPSPRDRGILRRNFKALLQIPDAHWGWYRPALRMGRQLLRQEKIDAIYSSGPPWTSHLVARQLKREFGIPWLIDFRDPWADSLPEETKPEWWHRRAKHMEEDCVSIADVVVGNTEPLTAAFQRRYAGLDAAKFRTLTNGFEDLPVPSQRRANSRKLLLHLGSLYAHRRIDTFLMALSELVGSGRLSPQSFEVLFQGETESSYFAEANRLVPQLMQNGCVRFSPRISSQQASMLLWQADLLLLFQGSHTLQVPAKFYEYLQTGIPILAVSEEGALAQAMEATQAGIWVRPADSREIAVKLLEALERPARNPDEVKRQFVARYHYRNLAGQLARWVEGVCRWRN
jgi:glycosyltransferase involved in cell wall biosynthesis